jgi:hypothetical protein
MPTVLNNPAFSSFILVLKRGPGAVQQDIIPFQFMPDTIRDSKVAVYNDIAIVGRSSPVKNYSHSGARMISFTLQFFVYPEAGMDNLDTAALTQKIDLCRSLVVPDYDGFIIKPPPRCIVQIGKSLGFLGVCKSVNVSYSGASPWDLDPEVLAHHATVDFTFEESLNIPISQSETRQGLTASAEEFGAAPEDTNPSGVGGSVGVSGPGGDQGVGAIPPGYQD